MVRAGDLPDCVVTIYASFEHRDYRSQGVVVGPREILTVGHVVAPDPARGDGELRALFLDDYPHRMGRLTILGWLRCNAAWEAPPEKVTCSHSFSAGWSQTCAVCKGTGQVDKPREGAVLLHFNSDHVRPKRSHPFWQPRIARVASRSLNPSYMLRRGELLRWPCETGPGDSGCPILDESHQVIGLHSGRLGWDPTPLYHEPVGVPVRHGAIQDLLTPPKIPVTEVT